MFNLLKSIRELLLKPGNQNRAENAKKNSLSKSSAPKSTGNPHRQKKSNPAEKSQAAPRRKSRKTNRRDRANASEKVNAVTPFPAPKVKPERPAALKEIPEVPDKKRFLDFPLPEAVQFGIQHMNFEYCTPIQAQALPELLAGRDLGGKAQSGNFGADRFDGFGFTDTGFFRRKKKGVAAVNGDFFTFLVLIISHGFDIFRSEIQHTRRPVAGERVFPCGKKPEGFGVVRLKVQIT